jgi:hypothetical protein
MVDHRPVRQKVVDGRLLTSAPRAHSSDRGEAMRTWKQRLSAAAVGIAVLGTAVVAAPPPASAASSNVMECLAGMGWWHTNLVYFSGSGSASNIYYSVYGWPGWIELRVKKYANPATPSDIALYRKIPDSQGQEIYASGSVPVSIKGPGYYYLEMNCYPHGWGSIGY